MTREKLFMGKLSGNGEWISGSFVDFGDFQTIWPTGGDFYDMVLQDRKISPSYVVIPESVGQYIGLEDMDGKRVFEGHWVTEKVEVDGKMVDACYPVVYSELQAAFCLDLSHKKDGSYLVPVLEEDVWRMRIGGHMYDRKEAGS